MAKGKYKEWLEEDKLLLLNGWKRDGLTDEQIAHNVGINVATLYEWKNKYSKIAEALKNGKEVADIIIENSLFKKATGYSTTVKKAIKIKKPYFDEVGRKIDNEEVVMVEEEVHIPADTTAQIFWLKNRRPDKWRDRPREDETSEAMKAMLESISEMTKIITTPSENRNIEDLES